VAAHTQHRQAVRALRGSVCREALASDALGFTRASCQAAFDASNTSLTLLGLERQLPRCAFCSLADALEAARHNQLAFLHLANPRTLCLVLHRHGPFGQLAQLGAIVHEGMRNVATLLATRQLAGERDGRRRGRAPLRRAPGACRDAAAAPARGVRWSTCSSPRCHLQPRARGCLRIKS
jgi:hypothetical protein